MTRLAKLNRKVRLWSSPKTSVSIIRLVTKREVCMTAIFIFCCLSILASLSQFPYKALQIRLNEFPKQSINMQQPRQEHPLMLYKRDVLWTNIRDPSFSSLDTDDIKHQSILTWKKNRMEKEKANNESLPIISTSSNETFIKKETDIQPENSDTVGFLLTGLSNSSFQAYMDSSDEQRSSDDYTEMIAPEDDGYYNQVDPERIKLVENVDKFIQRKKLVNYYHQSIKELPKQTKGIIILTNYRSGSTFLGELFNQNPQAFYTFEPLYPFTGDCTHQRQLKANVVHQLLQCDFPSMTELYRQIKGPMRKNHVDILCLIDDFCFRKNTKELCQSDLCPFKKPYSRYCKTCGPIHRTMAMNVCRKKKVSVVKAIRLCNILDLKQLILDPTMDIKIIHLVRDPRGIESSRKKINMNLEIEANANMTCERLLFNGVSGRANRSDTDWLKGKYMRVRYEDLSLKPLIMAEKIYNFVELEFLTEIQTWIKSNTRAKPTKRKVNPYSTRRDSAAAMQSWRTHLSLGEVLKIQSACSKTMDFYGYKSISTQNELMNLDEMLL